MWPPAYRPGDLLPSRWDQDELAAAWATFTAWREPRELIASDGGIVVDTAVAPAALAGAEALRAGGNAIDAALTTALTSIALSMGAPVSYAGISQLVYHDAATRTVHALDAGWNTVLVERDPLTIPDDEPSGRTAQGDSGSIELLVPPWPARLVDARLRARQPGRRLPRWGTRAA